MSSWVKLVGPEPEEALPPPPPPPPSASESEEKSAEASVSGPGLASPTPVKSDSAVERGGSDRCGRGGGGGRDDMVAGAFRGRERERRREGIDLILFLVPGVDFCWRFWFGLALTFLVLSSWNGMAKGARRKRELAKVICFAPLFK